jgi:adenosylhomocysteine nucleosidase
MTSAIDGTTAHRVTAVIAAMPEELEGLWRATEGATPERIGPFDVIRGELEGQRVLLAECGIGKVNAAALAQALLGAGAERVVVTGVAGALDPELRVGDLVVGVDAVQHDVDVRGLGYAPATSQARSRRGAPIPCSCAARWRRPRRSRRPQGCGP